MEEFQICSILEGLDVRQSVHHSTILKMKTQQDATLYQTFIIPFLIKLNMFRTTHRPSSGA
jgi:hypothetical protein